MGQLLSAPQLLRRLVDIESHCEETLADYAEKAK
jgi:hypothetical protein